MDREASSGEIECVNIRCGRSPLASKEAVPSEVYNCSLFNCILLKLSQLAQKAGVKGEHAVAPVIVL